MECLKPLMGAYVSIPTNKTNKQAKRYAFIFLASHRQRTAKDVTPCLFCPLAGGDPFSLLHWSISYQKKFGLNILHNEDRDFCS